MRCKSCGAPVENGVCTYCGQRVGEDPIQQSITQNKQSQGNMSYENPYRMSQCNKGVALVLCIFLGFFGAHYFYTKKTGMGLLYLFTIGLFYIGWIVDIFRIASGRFTDSNGNLIC